MKYDVIIVGGGAAGLSAAIFSCRRGLSTLIIAKDIGGQTATTSEIENYPGVGRVEGPELIDRFFKEASQYGAQLSQGEVTGISQSNGGYTVLATSGAYECDALILAFGKTPRDLSVPGEKEFLGRGVSYAFLTDAPLAQGKVVAVVGGGNSALEAVHRLAAHAKEVYLIHRRTDFRGEKILLDRLHSLQRVVTLTPYAVSEIRDGGEHLRLMLEHAETKETRELSVSMVFPCLGFEPRSSFVKDLVACDELGRVIVSTDCSTNIPGIFAAGDITTVPYQQIVVSAGEGAKAALTAYHYLQAKQGKRGARVDWGFHQQV